MELLCCSRVLDQLHEPGRHGQFANRPEHGEAGPRVDVEAVGARKGPVLLLAHPVEPVPADTGDGEVPLSLAEAKCLEVEQQNGPGLVPEKVRQVSVAVDRARREHVTDAFVLLAEAVMEFAEKRDVVGVGCGMRRSQTFSYPGERSEARKLHPRGRCEPVQLTQESSEARLTGLWRGAGDVAPEGDWVSPVHHQDVFAVLIR